jgi:hypothetical protein
MLNCPGAKPAGSGRSTGSSDSVQVSIVSCTVPATR